MKTKIQISFSFLITLKSDWMVQVKSILWASDSFISGSRMPAAGQHTIFTDIGGQEVGTDLYLVVSVYRLGKIVNQQVIMDIAIVLSYSLTLKSLAVNIGTAQGGAPGTSAMGPRDWS